MKLTYVVCDRCAAREVTGEDDYISLSINTDRYDLCLDCFQELRVFLKVIRPTAKQEAPRINMDEKRRLRTLERNLENVRITANKAIDEYRTGDIEVDGLVQALTDVSSGALRG